ncbi:MAG: hypothetical protein ACAI38_15535 [Myxococcota bacterium]
MEVDNHRRVAAKVLTQGPANAQLDLASAVSPPPMWRAVSIPDSRALATARPEELESFGCRGKVAIANKDQILDDIWHKLGGKPRFIYGLAEVGSDYGHAFCAFEMENPKTGKHEFMVPNIVGVPGSKMVQWISLTEYLFGVNDFKDANRQRGFYNRPYTLVALNDPKIDVDACRDYFLDLAKRHQAGTAKFSLVLPRIRNVLRAPLHALGLPYCEYGNCARWNFEAMKAAKIFPSEIHLGNFFTHNTMWPKRTAVRLLDGLSHVARDDVRVVHLERPPHAQLSAKGKSEGRTYVNVFTRIADLFGIVTARGRHYAHLSELAHVRVHVPKDTITAHTETRTPKALAAA